MPSDDINRTTPMTALSIDRVESVAIEPLSLADLIDAERAQKSAGAAAKGYGGLWTSLCERVEELLHGVPECESGPVKWSGGGLYFFGVRPDRSCPMTRSDLQDRLCDLQYLVKCAHTHHLNITSSSLHLSADLPNNDIPF